METILAGGRQSSQSQAGSKDCWGQSWAEVQGARGEEWVDHWWEADGRLTSPLVMTSDDVETRLQGGEDLQDCLGV